MSTHRLLLLIALICGAIVPACGGRSGLDDFSNGANNIIVSPGTADDDDKDDGKDAGSSVDLDAGARGDDGGSSDPDAGSGEPEREIGAACERDRQCDTEGATCVTQIEIFGDFGLEFPGGYCAVRDCEENRDCPAGSGCLSVLGQRSCLQLCEGDDECRTDEGYQCGSLRPGGPGGGQDGPTYCLPPFGGGGMPGGGGQGGGGQGGGGQGGGMDVTRICSFVCQDPVSTRRCMEQNDLSVCMQ